jgi:hypothetical protein
MNKQTKIILAAIAGVAIGAALYFGFTYGTKAPTAPTDDGSQIIRKPLDSATFLELFDVNNEGRVSREVFLELYDLVEFPIGLEGQPPMSAEDAFDYLDRNGDGVITQAELLHFSDSAWRRFEADAAARGLVAHQFKGRFIALNGPQERTYSREIGADARGELPFAGAWFSADYFTTWAEVTTEADGTFHAYALERDDRYLLLEPDFSIHELDYDADFEATIAPEQRKFYVQWAAPEALFEIKGRRFSGWGSYAGGGVSHEGPALLENGKLTIAQPLPRLRSVRKDAAQVRYLPDAPQTVYAREIRGVPLDDVDGNLQLARLCAQWDMPMEALMLYMRVLIFRPESQEAQRYWGVENRNGHFVPRKD